MNIRSTRKEDFALLYETNYALILQTVLSIVGNIEIAEELTQDAFERFYIKDMSYPSPDDAKYWLLRVAKNLALNYVRRNKREKEMVEKVKKMPRYQTKSDEGEQESIKSERREEVLRAINELDEPLRLTLILKEFSGLDYKAIGRVLGITETNVKVRIHRARKKLEERLGREAGYVY